MYFWNFSSDQAAKNLAYDEALLEVIESHAEETGENAIEALRVWDMPCYSVVLGRSSKATREAQLDQCARLGVPVLRRCSGGSTILAGAGCLMYSAILSIDSAHQFVMERLLFAVKACGIDATREGICDLVFGGKKFSGNALRIKRHAVLYHGTLLYSLDINLLEKLLGKPDREPEYRQGRTHADFVGNIPVSRGALVRELRTSFEAFEDWSQFSQKATLELKASQLLQERYSQDLWNLAR
jgi:lipoate-protein ligase A